MDTFLSCNENDNNIHQNAPQHDNHNNNVVRVGVAVIVMNEEYDIYMGIRKGSHGSGLWALPGGHLEFNETWEECSWREVYEEMNLSLPVEHIEYLHVVNDIMTSESKHYVTIFMICTKPIATKPITNEPHKCEGWIPMNWIQLQNEVQANPDQFFSPLRQLLLRPPKALVTMMTTNHKE